jgi:hypothetical protein
MPGADRVKEEANAILNDYHIVGAGRRLKGQTILESFAAPALYRQTNSIGAPSRQRLFHHRYCCGGHGERRFHHVALVS